MQSNWASVIVLSGIAAGCATDEYNYGQTCPRDLVPDCDVAESACQVQVFEAYLCFAERPGQNPPEVRVVGESLGPLPWPVKSLADHRFALEALGLWGAGEVPEGRIAVSIQPGRIDLATDEASVPLLGAAFATHDDLVALGPADPGEDFASSVTRRGRLEARQTIFAAFFTAARQGGSFEDYLPTPWWSDFDPAWLDRASPLLAIPQQATSEAISEGRRSLALNGIPGLDALLVLPEPPEPYPLPPLPEGWVVDRTERLGRDVLVALGLERSSRFSGSVVPGTLVSGSFDGGAWFAWRIGTRWNDPVAALEARGARVDVVSADRGTVVFATATATATATLRAISEQWLEGY